MLHCYKKYGYKPGEMVLMVGDFNVDSRKPFIETSKVMKYPGFKVKTYCIVLISLAVPPPRKK